MLSMCCHQENPGITRTEICKKGQGQKSAKFFYLTCCKEGLAFSPSYSYAICVEYSVHTMHGCMDAWLLCVCVCVRAWGLFTRWEYIGWLCGGGKGGGGERMELMMRKYQQQRRAAGFTSGTRRSSLLFSYCRQRCREREITRRS